MTRNTETDNRRTNKQAERDLAQKPAQSVAIVKPEPLTVVTDGWDDTDSADDRVIQGTLIKCVDGHWTNRDKNAIPAGTQLLAVDTPVAAAWHDGQPVETI